MDGLGVNQEIGRLEPDGDGSPGRPEREGERRAGERHLAVLQVARLILADRQALCLVRNLSSGGVMVHSAAPIAPDDHIAIELKFAGVRFARVAWRRDVAAGLQFDEPVDVARALGRVRDSDLEPRAPRVDIAADAVMTIAGETQETATLDVSQHGAKVHWRGLTVRDKVELAIEGLPPRAGRMCWADGERAGIAFNMALPFELLAGWTLDRAPLRRFADL